MIRGTGESKLGVVFEEEGECPGSDNKEDTFSTSGPCGARGVGEKTAPFKRVSRT